MELPVILRRVQSLGFKVFEGQHNMNMIAVRSRPQKGQKKIKSGEFRDLIYLVFQNQEHWVSKCFTCTTVPGSYYLKTASKDFGQTATAVIMPGQYRGSHAFGLHRGYPALRQVRPLKIARDGNKDDLIDLPSADEIEQDPKLIKEGLFAINVHRFLKNSKSDTNSKASAGCIVINDPKSWAMFYNTAKLQEQSGLGGTFTLTLIDDWS